MKSFRQFILESSNDEKTKRFKELLDRIMPLPEPKPDDVEKPKPNFNEPKDYSPRPFASRRSPYSYMRNPRYR